MRRSFGLIVGCLILAIGVTGCGGGGGGGGAAVQPTMAVLKLSTQGTLPEGTALAGLGVTIELPAGVTAATQSGGEVAATVVVPSGVSQDATVAPVYHAASGTLPGTLNFVLTSTAVNGFGTGEFATVTLALQSGTVPLTSDFRISSFSPVDLHGGSTGALSVACTLQVL